MQPIIPLVSKEYFAEITQKITRAAKGDRIALMSMTFDPKESGMPELISALQEAAEQGAQVTLLIDAHAFMFQANGWLTGPAVWPLQLSSNTAHYYQQKLRVIDRLKKAGCNVQVINQPRWFGNPYGGRSHIKLTIINDLSYLGGCNLSGDDTIDMMLRLEDPDIAQYLYGHVLGIMHKGTTRLALRNDMSYSSDEQTVLYIDSGKPKQSVIYDRALQLIDGAKEYVTMTCQFFPDKQTVQHLEQAIKRGVKVTLYFNDPSKQDGPTRLVHWLIAYKARHFHPGILSEHMLSRDHPHLHLKLIATDQGAILGSHNYVEAGVKFGTAEIALLRMDQGFSAALVAKALTQLL